MTICQYENLTSKKSHSNIPQPNLDLNNLKKLRKIKNSSNSDSMTEQTKEAKLQLHNANNEK